MQIKVTYGNKATINTGNYENENPFYSITSEIDSSELKDSLSANKWAKQTLKDIKKIINSDLAKEVNRIKNLKIPLPHHRIDLIDGIKTPHVTDIITPIPPTYIKDLEKHGTVGSMLDSAFKNYVEEGLLITNMDIPDDEFMTTLWHDVYRNMSERVKGLDDCTFSRHSIKIHNKKDCYCGEADALGLHQNVEAIFDCKKTKTITKQLREKFFKQMAAYAKALKNTPKRLVIISPYNDPIWTDDVDKYFSMFLKDRESFKEKYGL